MAFSFFKRSKSAKTPAKTNNQSATKSTKESSTPQKLPSRIQNALPTRTPTILKFVKTPQKLPTITPEPQLRSPRPSTHMSKDIVACAELLRKVYSLELDIWSADEDVGEDTNKEMLKMQVERNVLLDEIHKRMHRWKAMDIDWSDEEWIVIHDICRDIEEKRSQPFDGLLPPLGGNIQDRGSSSSSSAVKSVNLMEIDEVVAKEIGPLSVHKLGGSIIRYS